MQELAIEAILKDLAQDGVTVSEKVVEKMAGQQPVAGPEAPKLTKQEELIAAEYLKVYMESGNSHRKARRAMDKKYGKKKQTVIGSYKR